MKALQLIAYIAFATVLMSCQVELTPLDPNSSTESTQDISSSTDSVRNDATSSAEKTVTLYWSAPLERVNGSQMASSEVGGYEIRYKKTEEDSYQNLVISDSSVDQHSFIDMSDADAYVFEVAVFDTDGIYSDFVIASAN